MVFSYYLTKIPYSLIWHLLRLMHRLKPFVFYCGDIIDYYAFAPVYKYLVHVTIAADKKEVKAFLNEKGIPHINLPVFPMAVLMARHSVHKFPCRSIIKIGLRHGAYHFKKMTSAQNYNQFDLYLMTSQKDVEVASELGIRNIKAVGFPKLDPAFNGSLNYAVIDELKQIMGMDTKKPTVLFSATYDSSGMSAVGHWYDKLSQLTAGWNVLVTLHPWVKTLYKEKISTTPKVHFINDYYTLPYIMMSDVVVGDTSSFLAECCALDKPIITFTTLNARRSLDEIEQIIDSISYRINSFEELTSKLEYAILHKTELSDARIQANEIFFDKLDGRAGERAAHEIKQIIKQRR